MKKALIYLISCALPIALFIAGCAWGSGVKPQSERDIRDYYPLRTGNSWTATKTSIVDIPDAGKTTITELSTTRVEGEVKVAGVEAFALTVSSSAGPPDTLTINIDDEGYKLHKVCDEESGCMVFDPPVLFLSGDVASGRKYEAAGAFKSGDISGKITIKHSLVSLDSVTVPAGIFGDCLNVSSTIVMEMGLENEKPLCTSTDIETSWYCRAAGQMRTISQQVSAAGYCPFPRSSYETVVTGFDLK